MLFTVDYKNALKENTEIIRAFKFPSTPPDGAVTTILIMFPLQLIHLIPVDGYNSHDSHCIWRK